MTRPADILETKVLELKRWFPYDGCNWHYNYWLIEVTPGDMPEVNSDDLLDMPNRVISCEPIYTSLKKPLSEDDATRYYQDVIGNRPDYEHRRGLDNASIYDIDDNLHNNISISYWNSVFQVVPGFSWTCDECGTRQYKKPSFDTWHCNYRGDGGVGIRITAVYCDACANNMREEFEREEQKRAWEKQWPDHCWTCEGCGKTDDGDLCPDCIGEGACPRCGEFIGTAYDKPCPSCGFETGVMKDSHEVS